MKFFTKEVQIACVAIVALVVLYFGLNFLKGLNLFSNSNAFYLQFEDASGLSVSSPVYANGYKVGVVEEVKYDYVQPKKIVARVALDKQMRIPIGSQAEISSDLLGNLKINLVLTDNPLQFIAAGDTILGHAEKGMMGKVAEMVPAIEAMMPKLDSILTSLNTLLADPALANTLHNVEGMTANLNQTSADLRLLSASLGRNVPSMMVKADSVLGNTQQLTTNLAAIDVAAMTAKVNQTLANVEEMTKKLNSNEGTLGLLMRDATLYNNLSNTAADADSLLKDLKKHPKRYVHFSVFGKKDK
ncbi:MAG: MCE family protein [Prevotella sp.]|nr:MCE family protein [Prevotella sp.]